MDYGVQPQYHMRKNLNPHPAGTKWDFPVVPRDAGVEVTAEEPGSSSTALGLKCRKPRKRCEAK